MKKLHDKIPYVCKILEFVLAICVLIGFVFAAVHAVVTENIFGELLHGNVDYGYFLEVILELVIGIEFLEMLCEPDSANALEILIFLVARHMIVGKATAMENFVSVIAVCLLCIVRRLLNINKVHQKEEEEHHILEEEIYHLEEEKIKLEEEKIKLEIEEEKHKIDEAHKLQ